MAPGLIHADDPCFSWTDSVVEAVSETTNRLVRWRGIDIVQKPTGWTPRDPKEDLRQLSSPLFLPEEHAETIRDAHARSQAGLPARDWPNLVRATAHMTSQAAGLSSPEPDNIGGIWEAEAYLDTGLADVWTQERLAKVWPKTESGKFLPAADLPDFTFAGRDPAAASAARALLTEVVRQQGGTPASSEDFAALSDWMLSVKPDQRWEEVIALLPGTDELSEGERWRAVGALRRDFSAAVEQGKPELAADSVRTVAEKVDPLLRRLTQDPALVPLTPGRTQDSGGASVRPQRPGDSAVRRSPRSDRDRGGRR
ncbi:hypothetical protein EV649_3379 [Kribbella sp. VKM Ac-2569]|uniref:hypothetical protein n=1 Tax=Kribbella sp. VKM Ac-2569 TaxID=2512220 RepID=UPI00102C9B1F|nr:hypothetical protein [Kribbella sp. VKM Ac-2569]RZT20233.1 hypothetical protein EV649_3379 [Kribbella sp. VKM Ac-2569]